MTPSSPVRAIRPRPWDGRESPAHPSEPAYPCCLPALGGLAGCTPRGGPRDSLVTPRTTLARPRQSVATNLRHRGGRVTVSLPTEDSPSGLWRTLGKRVGGNPSRVRIPHPPPFSAGAPLPGFPAISAGPRNLVTSRAISSMDSSARVVSRDSI